MKKETDISKYKLLRQLQDLGMIGPDGKLIPAAEEGTKAILGLLAIAVAIPALAAALTVLVLAGGTGSVMLLWWFLF